MKIFKFKTLLLFSVLAMTTALFSCGGADMDENVNIPRGNGSLQDPYNPAGAMNAVSSLTWTSSTDYQKTGVVYVKDRISRILTNGTFSESGTYGNASFYISGDGSQSGEFHCFRILYLGNNKYVGGPDIKVGDEVIICGKLMNYKGNTPQTVSGEAYLYSLNGVTQVQPGTLQAPYSIIGAMNAVSGLTWTSVTDYQKTDVVYVQGKISRIATNGTFSESGTNGNATFYISGDGSQSGEFHCFRILYLGNNKYAGGTDIKVGDDVIICGRLMNYKGNTPQTVALEAYVYSINGAK